MTPDARPVVLIAGGGIAGLALALTCHQIGVRAVVFESVRELQPLGVGINLQPNAVRELYDLGLAAELAALGVATQEWALVGRNGNDVWSEPRGVAAGYRWPQFSVHRGRLQMMLLDAVVERMGPGVVLTGHRAVRYANTASGVTATLLRRSDGAEIEYHGDVLVGADGLHSAIRAQMHPGEGPPRWGGAVMWRGAAPGRPIRTGASFTLVGSMEQRFVHYPIDDVDPETGLQLQNWIAELSFDPGEGWEAGGWNNRVTTDRFLPAFEDWDFDWLDIPALITSTESVWEYPMVDRDPVDRWVDGSVALIGDAAHVMYPVGSNGASQAIVDARVLGANLSEHGVGPEALLGYESALCETVSQLVLRNRGAGPVGILGVVDERCGGVFDDIDDVISRDEIEAYMARYKQAAGFAIDELNEAPPTIPPRP
ncbi:MAG: flavin-dependent oxidoreductase [Ilumatobacter sp.]|uniref:flavin-dependent oxidoreductase n=1 Tax=Ilumatobacter sp. TaxID=1967498 RepID=UPI0026134DE8|nr:flavin-dependent oxidoreductase [Ilumatobacter sp.]MDJ0769976.1 flavin-dependent oxidoreductase [Ilumatobacter sp.]